MLDTDTKKKIDNCRDILVGKVPDPKSQVEQITIALIYKFMDDMDKESVELGGKATFFSGAYKQYAWSKVFDPKLGGYDIIILYSDAITKMNTNKNIPQLFRDIFKNAFLPYRDPETLKSFLKEINEFNYNHSEKLGDAFEYLLSVLGSQGEAGQFRTPRHIIDFIVEIVDPKKGETILDPACGTAGFLISSYKHILKKNTTPPKSTTALTPGPSPTGRGENGSYKGDMLSPDDRKRLMEQFEGYDISPDMVRLSLVNLYLHGFPVPKIHEYDTLTSEERWGDRYDVILANPPFMTPKGGIRPHKRFSIQANRSEVLFVDYMAEHLNMTGRAGIIVPEGIIFQSANAYKALRKMLIEDEYLFAVVSLPAGVFNPYSGVKTSILLLDKHIARMTDNILFVKIEHDGYDLGAQRKPNGKDDLPAALKAITEYKKTLTLPETIKDVNSLLVPKTKIAENGEYNLSGDRYRETVVHSHKDWPMVEIGEVCEIKGGGTPSKEVAEYWVNGSIKWISAKYINNQMKIDGFDLITQKAVDESSTKIARKGSTILISRVSVGKYAFADDDYAINQDLTALFPKDLVNQKYLFVISKILAEQINDAAQGIGVKGVNRDYISKLKIPVPSLEIQKEIVAEIEGYQKIIDGARAVVESWKPSFKVDPDWPRVALGEAPIEIIDGDRGENYPKKEDFTFQGDCLFLNTSNVRKGKFNFNELQFVSKEKDEKLRKGKLKRNDIVLTTRGTIGNIALYDEDIPYEDIRINSGMLLLRADTNVFDPRFILQLFLSDAVIKQISQILSGSAQPQLPIRSLVNLTIAIPPIDTQKQIVVEIEREQKIVEGNKELIEIYEKKIKDKIGEVWGK